MSVERIRLGASMDSYDHNSSGWSNYSNGFGTQTDPMSSTRFYASAEMDTQYLYRLYKNNALVSAYINLWKGDATRKGFELIDKENADRANLVEKELSERFKINGVLSKAVGIERLYGGGVIFCDIDDGNDPRDPLNENAVKRILGFTLVEKEYARPWTYNDLVGVENPGEPMHYQLTLSNAIQSKTMEVHASRLIRIPEIKADDNLSSINAFNSSYPTWPVSPIQKAYETIKRYGTGMQSTTQHLQNLVVDIFKVSNLTKKRDPEAFKKYIQEQWKMKNSLKANIMGEDDTLERIGTPLGGVEHIIDQINKDVSMAFGVSLSLLFSLESGGLGGSTIAGDRLNWFDKVKSYQNRHLSCVVDRIVYLMGLEKKEDFKDIEVKFNTLQELSDLERMEVREKAVDSMTKLVQIGYPEKDALDSMLSGGEMNIDTFNYNPKEIEEFLEDKSEENDLEEPTLKEDGEEDN
jgi:phage-related protein (TIGR01555 family)